MNNLIYCLYKTRMLQQIIQESKHKRNRSFHSNRHVVKLYQSGQDSPKKQIRKQQINNILKKAKHEYYVQQNLNNAINCFQECLYLCHNNNEALYLCGVCYLNQGKAIQAISKLQKISFSYQNKQNSLLLLAMAYNKINKIQSSLQTITMCLDNFQKFQEGYCFRGKLFLKIQKVHQAIKDFECSLKLSPTFVISKIGLGDCYRSLSNFQKALHFYNQVLAYSQIQANIREDVILKCAICHFHLQKYQKVVSLLDSSNFIDLNKGSQYYFYLGHSYLNLQTIQKAKGVINLQYCIKMQTNKNFVVKSVKLLLQLFIKDYQFYEAMNIVKLTQNLTSLCDHWVQAVQGFMLIIKAKYDQGYQKIKNVYTILKNSHSNHDYKINVESKQILNNIHNPITIYKRVLANKKSIQATNQKPHQFSQRKVSSMKHVRRPSFTEDARKQPIFNKNTFNSQKKTLSKPKYKFKMSHNFNLSLKKQNKQFNIKQTKFSQKQQMFLMPIILKFKAYCQFFKSNYLRSLDTYDEYQNYMRDVFGKQQNQDILYDKSVCEALLMTESEMYQDGLQKYTNCIDIYYRQNKCIPVQPILYKVIHIMQMALNFSQQLQFQQKKKHQQTYLQSAINLIQNYGPVLKQSHLAFYLQGLICLVLQQYESAHFCLQKTLKIAEQCSWKYLYIKGIIQIQNNKYYDAIKEFTAGLILQQKADLYLGRSIAFLLQGFERKKIKTFQQQTKHIKKSVNLNQNKRNLLLQQNKGNQIQANSEIFIENSFEDLQKFIQLQTQQQKISVWVTKLLFYNNAYEQAAKALDKIIDKNGQILQIQQYLQIYQGNFQEGGFLGQIIIRAFEGTILSQQQQKYINKGQKHIQKQLQQIGVQKYYSKWLICLHYYIKKKYSLLLKFLQQQILKKNLQKNDQLELRYNIAIVYLLMGETSKGINVINGINKFESNDYMLNRIKKIKNMDFINDEYVPDLQQQINSNSLRLSNYLISHSTFIQTQDKVKVYLKLSIPFPQFPKPDIKIIIGQNFLKSQLNINMVQKKINAPWINKKSNQVIQFTQQIIDANTQFLKESNIRQKQNESNLPSERTKNKLTQNQYQFNSSSDQELQK